MTTITNSDTGAVYLPGTNDTNPSCDPRIIAYDQYPESWGSSPTTLCGISHYVADNSPPANLTACCADEPRAYNNCFLYCEPKDFFYFNRCTHESLDNRTEGTSICEPAAGQSQEDFVNSIYATVNITATPTGTESETGMPTSSSGSASVTGSALLPSGSLSPTPAPAEGKGVSVGEAGGVLGLLLGLSVLLRSFF